MSSDENNGARDIPTLLELSSGNLLPTAPSSYRAAFSSHGGSFLISALTNLQWDIWSNINQKYVLFINNIKLIKKM